MDKILPPSFGLCFEIFKKKEIDQTPFYLLLPSLFRYCCLLRSFTLDFYLAALVFLSLVGGISVKIFQCWKPAPNFLSEFLTGFASKIRRDPILEITKSVMMTSSKWRL